jgi:hypothetical protein
MNVNLVNALIEAVMSIFCGPLIPPIMLAVMSASKRPVRTGIGVAIGAIAVVGGFILVMLAIFTLSGDSSSGKFGYLVYLVLGVVFLLLGLKTLIKKPASDEGGEDATIQKLHKMAEGGFGGLLLIGVLGAVLNSDQLVVLVGSVHDIALAGITVPAQVLAAIVVTIVATFLWWIVPLAVAVGGASAQRVLDKINVWLTAHMRVIEIVVFLVIGAYFTVRGLSGLF